MPDPIPSLSAILDPPSSIEIDAQSTEELLRPPPFQVFVTEAGPTRTLTFLLAAIRTCRPMPLAEAKLAVEGLPFPLLERASGTESEVAYRRIVAGGGKARIVAVG